MIRYLILFMFLWGTHEVSGQKIQVLDSSSESSIRGLSVVSNKIIWVSGDKGMAGVSIDGGDTWSWNRVEGFEKTDFRDIEGLDAKTAILMGVGSPAYILKTKDGGRSWKKVYENKDSTMFLDAMTFWNNKSGIVLGDPVDGRFFIARTFNGGDSWQGVPDENKPMAVEGEACFAASGTNIQPLTLREAVFVSGGAESHLFIRDQKIKLPMAKGSVSKGANSLAIKSGRIFIIVGGDYTKPDDTMGNCIVSSDGGYTWNTPSVSPSGYRSCVEYLWGNGWITCGPNGVDVSNDDGETWRNISRESFNVVSRARKGNAVFLAGTGGRIAKLTP